MSQESIDQLISRILQERPGLAKLATDSPVLEYLKPAIEWKQEKKVFPYAGLLSSIITSAIRKLYGEASANATEKHLEKSWVVETGAHLHIPRQYDRAVKTPGAQINSLLFQGQVLWALTNQAFGRNISLSLNSGRVPLDNTNSGAYLDLPALKNFITLASKKHHPDSPQTLIPAAPREDIEQKSELLNMYLKQKMIPQEQYELGQEILGNFLKVQSSFSDQVATTHAMLLNKVLPITQITLDSEFIGRDFVIALLKDKTSLLYQIFTDSHKKEKFYAYFGDIRTGWSNNSSPFYAVSKRDEGYRLTNFTEEVTPEEIVKGLEENTLWLTGVMKFFAMMVEGGIVPVGGWTQAGYCTQIKTQAVKFLKEFGYEERAKHLTHMPTHIAAVGPCWGLDEVDGNVQLLDAVTIILNPSAIDLSSINKLTGNQTLEVAAPTLYEFLTGEAPKPNYNDLKNELSFAVVKQ